MAALNSSSSIGLSRCFLRQAPHQRRISFLPRSTQARGFSHSRSFLEGQGQRSRPRRRLNQPPPSPFEKPPLWKPLLQLAVGVPFLGLIAYSMLTGDPYQLDSPSLAELDNATKSRAPVTPASPMRLRMEQMIKEQQQKIVAGLEAVDGNKFRQDTWTRPNGGGGISCVLQEGNVFEKAGVNVSVVYGTLPRAAIERMRADHKSFVASDVESLEFFAAGLSLVLHPINPMAPTVHLNYRYFETSDPTDPINGETNWWFGGGTDLTPSYLFPEDCVHFHKTVKEACDRHDASYYPRFKKWCDKYFYLPHRKECRGIGGIFFDDLDATTMGASLHDKAQDPDSPQNSAVDGSSTELTKAEAQEHLFSFCSDALASFLPSYVPILEKRKNMPFTPAQKDWQQLRRGRYVEFNLVYDRGTSFGMKTPSARVESILMSLPLTARWEYMHPVSGTGIEDLNDGQEAAGFQKEKEVLEALKYPRDWV